MLYPILEAVFNRNAIEIMCMQNINAQKQSLKHVNKDCVEVEGT